MLGLGALLDGLKRVPVPMLGQDWGVCSESPGNPRGAEAMRPASGFKDQQHRSAYNPSDQRGLPLPHNPENVCSVWREKRARKAMSGPLHCHIMERALRDN